MSFFEGRLTTERRQELRVRCSRWHLLASCWWHLLVVALLLGSAFAVQARPLRALMPPASGSGQQHLAFPQSRLFRPLLADPQELRSYATLTYVNFAAAGMPFRDPDTRFLASFVGLGGNLGLYGWRSPSGRYGAQIGVSGAGFSQFNLTRVGAPLLNTDFLAALPITARLGPWSARVRLFHQSSHLGDELLRNNPAIRLEALSINGVDYMGAFNLGLWGFLTRLYAGGSVWFDADPNIEPLSFQAGLEVVLPQASWLQWSPYRFVRPIVASDFRVVQAQNWRLRTNLRFGVEANGAEPTTARRFRMLVALWFGPYPFSQFFRDRRLFGVGLQSQFDF